MFYSAFKDDPMNKEAGRGDIGTSCWKKGDLKTRCSPLSNLGVEHAALPVKSGEKVR